MNPAILFAEIFVDELTRLPLSGVVICPGSRSTPLTVAFSRQHALPVYMHLDERAAAYFALGLALETGRPAAVVTTSGTATANLHPAVLEADRALVPLLLLTADRPPELRDSGANQTTDQVKLYGQAVRWYAEMPLPESSPSSRLLRAVRATADRAVAAAQGITGRPGPVHLNFPFRKPLEPEGNESALLADGVPTSTLSPARELAIRNPLGAKGRAQKQPLVALSAAPRQPTPPQIEALAALVRAHRRGVILAGPKAAPTPEIAALLRHFATAAGYPLLADALSGVRFGAASHAPLVLGGQALFLAAGLPHTPPPEVVFLFGAPPVSNAPLAFLANLPPETQVVAITPHAAWPDPAFRLAHWLLADLEPTLQALTVALEPSPPTDEGWLAAWQAAERTTREVVAAAPRTEGRLLADLVRALPAEARLFAGNSLPVRHLDEYAPPTETPLRVFANRGLSGIDGVVSSAAGVAAASQRPTVLVLGDLSLLHDLGGLFAVRRFGLNHLQIVVLNNDGGGIFQRLPIAQHEPPFTAMFRTPHGLTFEHAAALYGLNYRRLEATDLTDALRSALRSGQPHLLEVPTDVQAHETARQRLLARLR